MLNPFHIIVFLGLPLLGTGFSAYAAMSAYNGELKRLRHKSRPRRIQRTRGMLVIYMIMPSTTVVFGLVGLSFVTIFNCPDEIATALGANIGLAGFFCSIGEGLVTRVAARDIVLKPENFGKHLIVLSVCEVPLIFALVIMILSLHVENAPTEKIIGSNYIMAIASAGSLVTGTLTANVDPTNIQKRVLLGEVGVALTLVGFVIAFSLLMGFW